MSDLLISSDAWQRLNEAATSVAASIDKHYGSHAAGVSKGWDDALAAVGRNLRPAALSQPSGEVDGLPQGWRVAPMDAPADRLLVTSRDGACVVIGPDSWKQTLGSHVLYSLIRDLTAAPPQVSQPSGEVDSPEDRFEQFVQAGIARSPDPLRELGEYLGNVLGPAVAWEVMGSDGEWGWMHPADLEHYRAKGIPTRPLYAAPVAVDTAMVGRAIRGYNAPLPFDYSTHTQGEIQAARMRAALSAAAHQEGGR